MPTKQPPTTHGAFSATEARQLLESPRFQEAKTALLAVIQDASAKLKGVRPPKSAEQAIEYQKMIQDFVSDRGRDLYFPYVSSGLGSGALVELQDGSVKYDLISGIGINFFGHSHPELMSEMVNTLTADVMQGNLQPGHEARGLLRALLARVGSESRLKHGWLHCSGTMANETALKIIRQKKFPATRIFAFEDCFAGRSTAMAEITDSPGYRVGQPIYGEVNYLPFYSKARGLDSSVKAITSKIESEMTRYPNKYAGLMIELIQGEGGFNFAPREFYTQIFDFAKQRGLAIWADEIQTFGRTGELFAYQLFKLEQYMDVVTVGKMLHACAALYSDEYNPKPGLLAGTFTGSAVALRTGRRVLELLDEGKLLGENGRIAQLSKHFRTGLEKLAASTCRGHIGELHIIGGMVAFQPFSGTMEEVKAVLFKLYDLGLVAFYAGHSPYLIRMLPPFGVMKEPDIDAVLAILEKGLLEVAAKRGAS